MPPQISSASVRVMRSHDYNHFEVNLGTNDEFLLLEEVDELRKAAARLADKAVEQYKLAKRNAQKRASESEDRERLKWSIDRIRNRPESTRTIDEQARLKAFDDESWALSRAYDYQDDWDDEEADE